MQTLTGKTILVTRPAHQANPLCLLIEQAGGTALRFPTLAIAAPENIQAIKTRLQQLKHDQILIFTSANAVEKGLHYINHHSLWPTHCQIAAIGAATAHKLQDHGLTANIIPTHTYNSETLLNHPALQNVKDQSILIICGQHGRELLAETLRNRGATVDHLDVYRRIKPDTAPTALIQTLQDDTLSASITTSPEGLQNLMEMLNLAWHKQLTAIPMIVVSQKMVTQARHYGFAAKVFLSTNASDQSIIATVIQACRPTQGDQPSPEKKQNR